MLLDRVFRTTFRSFSTYFLIVLGVTAPLFFGYAYIFRDVIATSAFHGAIERLPEGQTVLGVGADEIAAGRRAFWIVCLIGIALVPFLLRATRVAVEAGESGGTPTAFGAWRGIFRRGSRRGRPALGTLVLAVGFGALVAFAGLKAVALIVEPLPERTAYLGWATAWAVGLALGAPFALVGDIVVRGDRVAPADASEPGIRDGS